MLIVAMTLPVGAAHAQSNAAEIKGGDLPGTIGPALTDIQRKYPDRNDLVAILTDETRRNPLTAMPPFGRNRILTKQEIDAIVDFLQTL